MMQESEISCKHSSYFLSAKIGRNFKLSLNVSDAGVLQQTGLLFWTLSIILSFSNMVFQKVGLFLSSAVRREKLLLCC